MSTIPYNIEDSSGGWNTVKERVCDYYGEATDIKRFATLESAQYYLDSLKPEITEVVKEIY